MMNLFGFFGVDESKEKEFGALFEFIQLLIGDRGDEEMKRITGYTGILGRVAYADTEITDDELSGIRSILVRVGRMSGESVESIIELLLERKVELLTLEEHFYTRMVNEVCDMPEKERLLASMFEIAAADGNICLDEENLLYRTAESLKIPRAQVNELKRDHMDVLSTLK